MARHRRSQRHSPAGLDPRPFRFEQAVMAFALLAGFVFGFELAIPVVTFVLAVSGAVGPKEAPIPRLFAVAMSDRLEPPATLVDAQTLRLTVVGETVVMAVASLLVLGGLAPLAWTLALLVVAAAALDAVSGTWIGARIYGQLVRRRRP